MNRLPIGGRERGSTMGDRDESETFQYIYCVVCIFESCEFISNIKSNFKNIVFLLSVLLIVLDELKCHMFASTTSPFPFIHCSYIVHLQCGWCCSKVGYNSCFSGAHLSGQMRMWDNHARC